MERKGVLLTGVLPQEGATHHAHPLRKSQERVEPVQPLALVHKVGEGDARQGGEAKDGGQGERKKLLDCQRV